MFINHLSLFYDQFFDINSVTIFEIQDVVSVRVWWISFRVQMFSCINIVLKNDTFYI